MKKLLLAGLGLITLVLVTGLVLFHQPPVGGVQATVNEWSQCESTGPQCGTDDGTQYRWVCPDGYSQDGKDCRKRVYMDRPYEWECPSGYSEYGSQTQCRKLQNGWKYANKEKDYKNCPSGWGVNESNHTQCKKWDYTDKVKDYQKCQTGIVQYDACNQEGECPNSCGYEGGEVPNGQGGYKVCEATPVCEDTRDRVCDDPTALNYDTEIDDETEVADRTVCEYKQPETKSEEPKHEEHRSEPSAPQCGYTAPVKTGANFHIYRKGGEVIAKWFPTEGNKANIYYRENTASDWQHALRDIDNSGYATINVDGQDYTFALQQANECAGGPLTSPVIDGDTTGWVLFQ